MLFPRLEPPVVGTKSSHSVTAFARQPEIDLVYSTLFSMPTHEHMVGSHGEGRPTRRDKGKEGQHGIESARTEERAGAVWHSHGASDPVWGIQVSKELN